MRRTKRLIALLLAMTLVGLALAEESAAFETPVETPVEAVAETPSETPAEAPVEAPAETAEEASAETPVETPADTSVTEEVPNPEEAPAEVPEEEAPAEETPAEMPVEEAPTEEAPTEEAPAEVPVEQAPAAVLTLVLASPEGMGSGNYCAIPLSDQVSRLVFSWSCTVGCDGYTVAIAGPDGASVLNSRQSADSLELPLAGLAAGRYSLSVAALQGDAVLAQAQLTFDLTESAAQPDGAPQEGTPEEGTPEEGASEEGAPEDGAAEEGLPAEGMPEGGGFPGGGMPSGMRAAFKATAGGQGGQGGAAEAERGFHVTAGTALTSAHNTGDRDMSLYGSLALSWDEEAAMTALTLDGTALDIALSDGGEFTAELDGTTLALSPIAGARAWSLNGYALKTLARSGIETLLLSVDGETISFPTQPALTGSAYGALCAAGYVSADYDYTIAANGVEVRVDGATWQLSEDGELS